MQLQILTFLLVALFLVPFPAQAKCWPQDRKELIKHAFEVVMMRKSPAMRFDTRDGKKVERRKEFFAKVYGFKAKDLLEIHSDMDINAWDGERKKRMHIGVAELEFSNTKTPQAVVSSRRSMVGGRAVSYFVADTYNRHVFIVFTETPKDKDVSKFLSRVPEMVEESCGMLATRPFRDD